MGREWKPGDVVLAADGSDKRPFFVFAREGRLHTMSVDGHQFPMLYPDYNTRPLILIDPEDREQVERLVAAVYEQPYATKVAGTVEHWQAALREFANPTPPKPDEPTGLGAVVEDANGVRWVKVFEGDMWQDHRDRSIWRGWNGVNAVRVLSEGVAADA